MSLKVWLPLDGDLHNQGLSNAIFSKTTNVWGTGKIGEQSLLTSTGTGNVMVNELKDKKEFSIAYWVKIDSSLTFSSWQDIWAVDYTNATGTYPIRDEHTSTAGNHQLLMAKETNVGSNANGYISMTITNAPNTWQHIVLVKGLTQTKSYVNGELKLTRNNTDFETSSGKLTGNVRIGAATCGAYLNDFRIYDHCLSTTEVHEIAQGLILHYKLDQNITAGENLMPNSLEMPLGSANPSTGTWRTAGTNNMTRSRVAITDTPEGNGYGFQNSGIQTANDGSCYGIDNFPLEANTNYIISMWARIITGTEGYAGFNVYSATPLAGWQVINKNYYSTKLATDGSWTKCWMSFTTNTATTRNIYIGITTGDTNVTTQMCNVHIEKGSLTNYNIINDNSGYNHNGILNDPNAIFITNTIRYNSCIQNNQNEASSTYLIKGNINMPPSTALTFTWWMKPTLFGKQISGLFSTSSNALPTDYQTTAANMRDSCFDCCNSTGTCVRINVANYITLNEWHHYALTYNGSQLIFYKDGEQKITANQSGSLQAFSSIFLFYSKAGGVDRTTSGNLSDFRIYCTSLLDTDIKQLYNVGMKVDKVGNIHAFEFKEESGITKLEKTGTLSAFDLYDNKYYNSQSKIGKNSWEDILHSDYYAITTKDKHQVTGTVPTIPAATIKSLAGKILKFSYDVCAPGQRLSEVNGETAWNKIRYGIHGSMTYTNAAGTTETSYPFTGYLTYTGNATHTEQSWTIPVGYQVYGDLTWGVQPYDKPSSTNTNVWFISNVKLEVSSETSPGGWVSGTQLIER